jgi:AraC-like DNA-binding protein
MPKAEPDAVFPQLGEHQFLLYESQIYGPFMAMDMRAVQLWSSPLPLRLVMISPDFRTGHLRRHHHLFYELALVLRGRCTWHLGTGRRRVRLISGEALLLPPRRLHAEEIAAGEKARLAWLGFEFEGKPPAWCQQPIPLEEDAAEIANYLEAIAREHHSNDTRSQTRIRLALQSVLLLLERRAEGSRDPVAARAGLNPRQTHTVESAAHYFRNNLRDPLSVAQLAAYHSLCPGHFSSLFRRQHRITPRGFLRQARVQRAADLLAETEMPLKEIASECGFVDSAHLCKSFKQDRRVTPNRFRAKTRRKS